MPFTKKFFAPSLVEIEDFEHFLLKIFPPQKIVPC